jgi:ferredoxin
MGVNPEKLPLIREGRARGLGNWKDEKIDVLGNADPISDFKMPVTYQPGNINEKELNDLLALYPPGMMNSRTVVRPVRNEDKCIMCGECKENCPAEALTLEPQFHISDACITCFCCVELCPEGALEVPDVEAFQHY